MESNGKLAAYLGLAVIAVWWAYGGGQNPGKKYAGLDLVYLHADY